ncbi:hypothetical protein EI94DRAFT_1833098 [Lactarius quietus]|nr:hypothetical protein EI94DRAFT_1833098 [Lactarius quietus]
MHAQRSSSPGTLLSPLLRLCGLLDVRAHTQATLCSDRLVASAVWNEGEHACMRAHLHTQRTLDLISVPSTYAPLQASTISFPLLAAAVRDEGKVFLAYASKSVLRPLSQSVPFPPPFISGPTLGLFPTTVKMTKTATNKRLIYSMTHEGHYLLCASNLLYVFSHVVAHERQLLEDLVWAVLGCTETRAISHKLLLVKLSILQPEYLEDRLAHASTSHSHAEQTKLEREMMLVPQFKESSYP